MHSTGEPRQFPKPFTALVLEVLLYRTACFKFCTDVLGLREGIRKARFGLRRLGCSRCGLGRLSCSSRGGLGLHLLIGCSNRRRSRCGFWPQLHVVQARHLLLLLDVLLQGLGFHLLIGSTNRCRGLGRAAAAGVGWASISSSGGGGSAAAAGVGWASISSSGGVTGGAADAAFGRSSMLSKHGTSSLTSSSTASLVGLPAGACSGATTSRSASSSAELVGEASIFRAPAGTGGSGSCSDV